MKTLIITFIIAVIVSLIAGPIVIPVLRRFKFGQNIRSDGPSRHLSKSGTPTMGGIIFMLGITVAVLIMGWKQSEAIFILIVTWLFAIVGFLDDSLKIIWHRSLGLTAKQKMFGQFVAALFLILGTVFYFHNGTELLIPFSGLIVSGGLSIDLPMIVYIIFAFIVVIGTANAVNLTDGLDGLASGITFITALAYLILTASTDMQGIALFLAALAGGCLGFWFFNRYPAKVFMGDTGSLALGGALAACAVLSKTELFLLIIGGVYVVETLSVMIQVVYFKLTHGKRIFKMAPLHHHYELSGWSEVKVVGFFWFLSFAFSVVGILSYINIM